MKAQCSFSPEASRGCNNNHKSNSFASQESIASEFLDRLVKWSKNIKISDPLEEGCRLGPVVSRGQVVNNLPLFLSL